MNWNQAVLIIGVAVIAIFAPGAWGMLFIGMAIGGFLVVILQ